MRLVVIGSGYVGLVTGACFSDLGTEVVCVDRDARRISGLRQDQSPIYEPELTSLLTRNRLAGRLSYSEILPALGADDVAMIAVGTPPGEEGAADLSAVLAAAAEIAAKASGSIVV